MTTPSQATWGEIIQSYKKREGLTQEALASRLGVSVRSIGGWLRGEHEPHAFVRREIERAIKRKF